MQNINSDISNSLKDNLNRLNNHCDNFDNGNIILANDIASVVSVLCAGGNQEHLLKHKISQGKAISDYMSFPKMIDVIRINRLMLGMVELHLLSSTDINSGIYIRKSSMYGKNAINTITDEADWVFVSSKICVQSFDSWWNQEVIFIVNNTNYTRYQLIKYIRDTTAGHTEGRSKYKKKYKEFKNYLTNSQNKEWECIKNLNNQPIKIKQLGVYFTIRAIGEELKTAIQQSVLFNILEL